MEDEIKKDDNSPGSTSHREHKRNESEQTSPRAPPYAEHGPLIDRSQTAELNSKRAYNAGLLWPRIRHYCRKPFAEFMGTFILIMFGDGSVAQVVLSNGDHGDYQSISWGWVSMTSIKPDYLFDKLTANRALGLCSASMPVVLLELISIRP